MKNVLLALKVSILFVLLCPRYCFAENIPIPFKNGEAVIVLKDDLKHPFFWWPVTLLQYQVGFDKGVNLTGLALMEKESGKSVPFQLSETTVTANGDQVATVSILSNLPSGVSKTFVLKTAKGRAFPEISTQADGLFTVIRTNKLTVRIPGSQQITANAPGPVVQVATSSQPAMGASVFNAGKKQLQQIKTEKTSSGPLFAAYRITYLFRDGAKYIANVKCIQDYDFIELNEEISGIKQEDSVSWKLNWTGFQPTHRQAPNHPYGQPGTKPGFESYNWETIEQKKLNYHHGIMPDQLGGKIPYEVGIYEPWPAERTITSTLFWDEKKNQSLGVFITDAAQWNDMDYAIWHSSKILSVRFFYNNGILTWQYPVSQGTRATAISCYPHQKDIDYMNDLEVKSKGIIDPLGFKSAARISQLSYNTFLQNRFGTIHLDKVKGWDLIYPDSLELQPVIFKNSRIKSGEELMKRFLSSGYNTELTVSGPRQNSGYAPVPAREFNHHWVDGFNRFYGQIPNKEGKARTAAMYLMHAYVAADEEYMPMKYMLSGHPNFLADVKTIPALAAFQFPKHPMASQWGDLFEKYVELNTRYHTRPSVKAWDAQGGRWTENLGTYVWAFLRPTLRTAYVLKESSGKNRVATPGMAQVGSWILNALSAPYNGESLDFYRDSTGQFERHYWGIVSDKEGPRRVHPPQGAHAERRKPASSLWFLGSMLNRYDPLLSEHLRYVAKPTDDDMESLVSDTEPFNIMFPRTGFDRGTRPDFKSVKLTGYGNILRAAVDSKDELSIHLGQIDDGPNYRMGTAGQGGSGMIYFYAGGKSYSHNGREDVGDRKLQDTDLLTSFGVYKDGFFKSIGQNVLSRPLYNLGTGQFTEIVPSQTSNYSWPEYQGRSIMLVGSDYFITYDDVYNNNIGGRFSWFTHPKEDLPNIKIVKIGTPRAGYKTTKVEGDESKGVWYDMLGDCMAFVSHRTGFTISSTDYGAIIKTPAGQTDYIFRNDKPMEVNETDKVFSGTAGFIRTGAGKEQELVLFHGTRIGNGGLTISTTDTDAGISAKTGGTVNGRFYSLKPASVRFELKEAVNSKNVFYIDGNKIPVNLNKNSFTVQFPAGEHYWQFSDAAIMPMRPQIDYSEDDNGNVNIAYHATSASKYLIEYSNDNGDTWKKTGETTKSNFTIKQEASELKAHIRVTAVNGEYISEASPHYPVYFTKEKPLYPDGLKTTIASDGITIRWGKVLGVSGYKLYRRREGEKTWQSIFTGNTNLFEDKLKTEGVIYEYAIASVNKNGESIKSLPVSTDPASWLHWEPQPGEGFRRTNTHNVADKTLMYYPE